MDIKGKITERFEITNEPTGAAGARRVVGVAFKKETDDRYTVYINLLQGVKFFVVPLFYDKKKFKLFCQEKSRKKYNSLQSLVGTGELTMCEQYIRIWIPDLRQYYYIRLEPRAYYYNYKVA